MNSDLPKIYVINLLRSTERKQSMQTQLDSLQLPFEWEIAVDGHNLDEQALEQYQQTLKAWRQWKHPITNKTLPHKDISKTQFGCATSHLNVYKKIVAHQTSWSVIFEDDIILTEKQHFKTMLSQLKTLNLDCDIIYLGGTYREPLRTWTTRASLSFFGRRKLPFGYSLGYFVCKPKGALAYMISLSGAQKMLQRNTSITNKIDIVMSAKYRTPCVYIMGINPPLARICGDFESTIECFPHTTRKTATLLCNKWTRKAYRILLRPLSIIIVFFLKFGRGLFHPKAKHIKQTQKRLSQK